VATPSASYQTEQQRLFLICKCPWPVAPGADCLFFKRSGERPISRLFHGFEAKLSTALTTQKGDKACAKFRGFDVYLMPL